MSTTRMLDRAALTATVAGGLLLTTVPAAVAGPLPVERTPSGTTGGSGTGGAAEAAGTTVWEVVAIASAGAALALLIALIMLSVMHHRGVGRAPARTA